MAIELIGECTEEAVAVAGSVGGVEAHTLELCVEVALHLFWIIEEVAVLGPGAPSDAFVLDGGGGSGAAAARPSGGGALRPPHDEGLNAVC